MARARRAGVGGCGGLTGAGKDGDTASCWTAFGHKSSSYRSLSLNQHSNESCFTNAVRNWFLLFLSQLALAAGTPEAEELDDALFDLEDDDGMCSPGTFTRWTGGKARNKFPIKGTRVKKPHGGQRKSDLFLDHVFSHEGAYILVYGGTFQHAILASTRATPPPRASWRATRWSQWCSSSRGRRCLDAPRRPPHRHRGGAPH